MKVFKGERSDFSKRLIAARKKRGYTQSELAKKADINVKTIARWEVFEKDVVNPKESVNTLRAIHVFKVAQALDVTPEYLILGDESMEVYMKEIEEELMNFIYIDIISYHKKPLTDKVLAHLKLTDEFVNRITSQWRNFIPRIHRPYVEETIIRYCHNRPQKDKQGVSE